MQVEDQKRRIRDFIWFIEKTNPNLDAKIENNEPADSQAEINILETMYSKLHLKASKDLKSSVQTI